MAKLCMTLLLLFLNPFLCHLHLSSESSENYSSASSIWISLPKKDRVDMGLGRCLPNVRLFHWKKTEIRRRRRDSNRGPLPRWKKRKRMRIVWRSRPLDHHGPLFITIVYIILFHTLYILSENIELIVKLLNILQNITLVSKLFPFMCFVGKKGIQQSFQLKKIFATF